MRGSAEELDEVLASIDMESWLDAQGIRYKRTRGSRGQQLNIKECPCCGNSNHKVYLNADSGLGNCFSGDCEKKFNKWSFISAVLGTMSKREVVDHIKQFAIEQGWRPPKLKSAPVNYKTELKLPESYPLPYEGKNLKYLENRNISGEIAAYFGLRYSNRGFFAYLDETGGTVIQDYAKRVIIPIFDLDGNLVSFQGRDTTGESEKRYLFPPGFASTGSIIFNGHNAIGSERIVMGEGVFDVMATKIALDGQMERRDVTAVGSFGKHLSFGDDQSQIAKLMRMQEKGLKEITLMWDAEKQALEDAAETALLLKSHGFVARVAVLPKGRDPNEVVPQVVRDAFWRALPANTLNMTKLKLMASGY